MRLYTPESVYQLDRAAVDLDHFSEVELMGRAGAAVWRQIERRWPATAAITVFAGSGNNGGDAFVVALCAREQGVDVQLLVQGDLARQSETSRHYRERWLGQGGDLEDWQGQAVRGELIVDGLLGIGLQRDLNDDWQSLVNAINQAPQPCIAIDVPSGLNARTGMAQPVAIQADLTVTFIGRKCGQYLADGPDFCGELIFDDLGTSRQVSDSQPPVLRVIEDCVLPAPRSRNSHKNHYGHLLIVGGDLGMSGAVALAGHAALRCGAGLVTALVHPECRSSLAHIPEIMTLGWEALEKKLGEASIIIVGPGLGDSPAALDCLQGLRSATQPMVIDASALRAEFLEGEHAGPRIITPHPGEAARLLSQSTADVQNDRLAACAALLDRFGCTTVLKGSGSLVADPAVSPWAINTRGHAGMAAAGMGDVLSGIIGGLLGQGLDAPSAAISGVYLHALCAEAFCPDRDARGVMASDICEALPRVMAQLDQRSPTGC